MNQKFVVVSHILPPSPSGQAVMLYRLLSGLHPSQYCLISKYDYRESYFTEKNWVNKLAGKYYSHGVILKMMLGSFYFLLLPFKSATMGFSLMCKYLGKRFSWFPFVKELTQLLNINLEILIHTIEIFYVVKKENCKVIVACTGDIRDLPGAFLASKLSKTALIIYSFDDFVYQWLGIYRDVRFSYAKILTPIILRRTHAVIVTNEILKKEYQKRYQIDAKIIHNSASEQNHLNIELPKIKFDSNMINLVFTGAIYTPHYDVFRNLIIALLLSDNPNLRLHLFTAQPIKELEKQGITGPKIVHHSHLPFHQVPSILKLADILFLPLGFETPYPELIKTSFPGKMTDYLQSGKPILVHAPKDSFVSWYFKTYRCGMVVDENNPLKLAKKLNELLTNSKKQAELSKRAVIRAGIDFSQKKSRRQLMQIIKGAA